MAQEVRMVAATLLVLAGAPAIAADTAKAAPLVGTIVFTHAGALQSIAPDGKGGATELAKLPDDAGTPLWLEANPGGSLIAIELAKGAAWFVKGETSVREGGCTGRARPAPNGDCVICAGASGPLMVNATKPETTHQLPASLREVNFLGPKPPELAALGAEGVFAFERRTVDQHRLLAKPGATSHLLVAPDGDRAVAIFGDGDDSRVYSFQLDGEGVPRRIGGPGVPTAWSDDSAWVIVQEGTLPPEGSDEGGGESILEAPDDGAPVFDRTIFAAPAAKKPPPKKKPAPPKEPQPQRPRPPAVRACVVRAVGGESKCWDGYTGLALSPDSAYVLLQKGTSLYVGTLAGVRPEPPKKIVDDADPAATWVP